MHPEPEHTRTDELVMLVHHRREVSRQQLLKRWREWEMDVSVVTDAHTSTCFLLLLPPTLLYVARDVEWGRKTVAVCAAACMLACVAHLFCVYARRQWYVRNRTPTIVALRIALVCIMLSAWVLSSLRLRRSQEVATRVIFGIFMSQGYQITNQLLQLELQVVLLVITRALLCFSATRREGMECSYVGICRRSVDGVDVGHAHLWDVEVPHEERTASSPIPFAYSFDGFLFDALLYIMLPLAVANAKQKAREVTFAREELRRETEARRQHARFDGNRASTSENSEWLEDDAGDHATNASSGRGRRSFPRRPWLDRVSRISQQVMPLMEFPDDALEERFDRWYRRAMLRVDLTRAAISCCTSLLWYQKFRIFCTAASAPSFLPLSVMTWLFTVNLFQVYLLLGHTQTYLRLRNAVLIFGKLNMAASIFVTTATLAAANATILIQHYERYPQAAAEGEAHALRAWLAETAWARSAYQPEPSTGPETTELLAISAETKVIAVLLQFFGTHQLMRANVGLAVFYVFSACVLEPLVLSQPPDSALPIRSKLFPSFTFTRLTNIIVDLTLLFLTGYLAERHLRASFAKEINLAMRQAEFLRSPLAQLRMTVASFPPRPASRPVALEESEGARMRPDAADRRGVERETDGRGADPGRGTSAGRSGAEATTARRRPTRRRPSTS